MSAKQASDAILSPCTECGQAVEGERFEDTNKGLIYYSVVGGKGFTHSHRSARFYEQRTINARNKPKAVEKAMAKLLLNPTNKKALQVLRKWRVDKLFALATDPTKGYASIRAASKLIEEFTGEQEEQPPDRGVNRVVVSPNQMPLAAETPKPEIIIHMRDPVEASKPRYDPMFVKPEIIEEDYEELPEESDPDPAFDDQETDRDLVEFGEGGTRKRKPQSVTASFTVWPGGEITRQLTLSEAKYARRPVNPYAIKGLSG